MSETVTKELFEHHTRDIERRFNETHERIGGVKRSADDDIAEVKAKTTTLEAMFQEQREGMTRIEGVLMGIRGALNFLAAVLTAVGVAVGIYIALR